MAGGPIYTGGIPFFKPGVRFKGQTVVFSNAGAPTSGSSGTYAGKAGKGSVCVDRTNANVYINTNTLASPTWTQVLSGTGLIFPFTTLSVNGAIPPHTPANYAITKAGVLADTLAAPTATTDDGVVIVVTSTTANAHTITATGLLKTGSAAVNVATFNAFAGSTLSLVAYQALWYVLYANGISFS